MGQNVKVIVIWIAVGTVAWLSAGVIALAIGAESKVIWTCVMGAVLGVTGIRYTIRRGKRSGI